MGAANDRLTGRRMDFERVRSYWTAKRGTWLALDFESWERENSLLLEVGWSLVRWDDEGKEVNEQVHLIVKERMQYQNGTYVQGNRDVSRVLFVDGRWFGRWEALMSVLCGIALQFWTERAGSQECDQGPRQERHRGSSCGGPSIPRLPRLKSGHEVRTIIHPFSHITI